MYRIYLDGEVIHAPALGDKTRMVLDPTLKEEIHKAASLTFTLPDVNVGSRSVSLMTSTVSVYDDDDCVFMGRPVSIKRTWYNSRTVTCDGPLGWLRDAYIKPVSKFEMNREEYMSFLLDVYNNQVSANRQIAVGSIYNPTAPGYTNYTEKYGSIWDALQYPFIENPSAGSTHGRWSGQGNGMVYITYQDVDGTMTPCLGASLGDAYPDMGGGGQVIRFASNLLDLEQVLDGSDVYTVAVPVNSNEEGVQAVHGTDQVENAEGIAQFGRITRVVRYSGGEYEDLDLLLRRGEADLNQAVNAALTINLTAVDLHQLGLVSNAIRCGYFYRVVSEPHGLDTYYQCIRREIHLADPSKSKYRLGWAGAATLSSRMVSTTKALAGKQASMGAITNIDINSIVSR